MPRRNKIMTTFSQFVITCQRRQNHKILSVAAKWQQINRKTTDGLGLTVLKKTLQIKRAGVSKFMKTSGKLRMTLSVILSFPEVFMNLDTSALLICKVLKFLICKVL